ncbi:hypothetical protein LWI29_000882 [Acer saccharum]|uniref:Amino acid transporter transmembrane domain-containing protein n=1 Tax=Acer saccharum TaxID=4024 RepID=A0AA39VSY4_ACESA|nr:hypothetical protein LWI29_000882 [Acer saccharum]
MALSHDATVPNTMTTMAQSHKNISSAASVLEIESHDDITTSFDQERGGRRRGVRGWAFRGSHSGLHFSFSRETEVGFSFEVVVELVVGCEATVGMVVVGFEPAEGVVDGFWVVVCETNTQIDDWLPTTGSRNAKWWYSAVHNVTAMVGASVLGLPYAMAQLGWGPGVAMLVLSWVITLYTLWQMVEMHEMIPGRRFGRYHELKQYAFGEKLGLYILVPPQLIVEVAVCIIYMVTGGKSLKRFHDTVCSTCKDIKLTYFIIILGSVHFVLSHLPNFNSISCVSMAAAAMSLSYSTIAWGASIHKGVQADVQYGYKAETASGKVFNFFSAFGYVAFAFAGAHNVVLEIQATIPSTPENPSKGLMWRGVVIAYIVVALCYFPVALIGYWMFGNSVEDNILISLEKPAWLIGMANIFVVIHVIGSYRIYAMLVFNKMVTVLVTKLNFSPTRLLNFVVRNVYVGFTMFIAITFPFFGDLLAFFGGFALVPITYFVLFGLALDSCFGSSWLGFVCGVSCFVRSDACLFRVVSSRSVVLRDVVVPVSVVWPVCGCSGLVCRSVCGTRSSGCGVGFLVVGLGFLQCLGLTVLLFWPDGCCSGVYLGSIGLVVAYVGSVGCLVFVERPGIAFRWPCFVSFTVFSLQKKVTGSRNAKWWYSAFHKVTAMVGASVLGLPYAMAQLGWGPGVVILVLSWVITLYTLWQMVEMHEMVTGKRFGTNHELLQHAFGEKLGLYIVVPQQLIVEVAVCIVYMVTGGKSLKKFHDTVCSSSCKDIKLTYFIMIFASVHFVLSHLPNFNSISCVSLAAAAMSLSYSTIAWGASIHKGVQADVQYGYKAETASGKVFNFFSALGDVAFAFSGVHNVVLEIQATIPSTPENPSRGLMWRGVVVAYIVVAICYFPVALIGYWMFGNSVEDNILISLEKPAWLIVMANIFVVIHVIGSYRV